MARSWRARRPETVRQAVTGAPKGASSAGQPLAARDLAVLRWVCEQYAARTDHIAALIGRDNRSARRVVQRLAGLGLVRATRLFSDQPAWVFATRAGARAGAMGFGAWSPRPGLMAHVGAVNEVRLHVHASAPGATWICERALAQICESGEHLPDGVVEIDSQRHAIEVELTVKSRRRVVAILDELTAGYDATVYFCAPAPRRQLERMSEHGRWPMLVLRDLPEGRRSW